MWILPGLLGPPLGALIASTVGWRWAFLTPYPVLVAGWILLAPALDLVPAGAGDEVHISVRWPLQLMVGAGVVFTSLTVAEWWTLGVLAAGLAVGLPALARIVPAGTFRLQRGVPAAAVAAFLLSAGFLAVDAFLTLMLTKVRGLSLALAGAALTIATVTWALGSAWQSGWTDRLRLPTLLRIGVGLTMVGFLAEAAVLMRDVPVFVAYVGWAVVGLGMGIAFPTLPLAAMRGSTAGAEGADISSVLLLDMLGVATGAGLGGGVVALTTAMDIDLAKGIGGAFAIGIAIMLVLFAVAGRISAPRASTIPTSS
jgi:predicted MFS family arabinose efflux permease